MMIYSEIAALSVTLLGGVLFRIIKGSVIKLLIHAFISLLIQSPDETNRIEV